MAIKRSSTAVWNGNGKEGKGTVSTASGVLADSQYSYNTRFEDGKGTNPEELIAAAHAGCFSMKLAFVLQAANITAESINTSAVVSLENGVITEIELTTQVKANVSDIDFQIYAMEAKENCPISKLFNATIRLNASLV